MPGSNFVAQFFFEQSEGKAAGWSENFYIQSTSLADAFDKVTRTAAINARLNILSVEYRMTYIRVSDIEVRGDSLVRNFGGTDGDGKLVAQVATTEDVSEEPWDGLLCRLEAGPSHRRGFIMRGLPTGVTTRSYTLNLVQPFVRNFNNWRDVCVKGIPYSIRSRGPGTTVNPPPTSIDIDITGKGLILNYPPNAIPVSLVDNATISVSGARQGINVNGIWKIRTVIPTLGQVWTFPKRQPILCTVSGIVTVKLLPAVQLFPMSNALMERGASRKTGRPFGSLVGRRSVRRA